jgi:CDP-glucose 4,6-dehydratase
MAEREGSLEDLEVMKSNLKFWKNKRVLITGHKGFLGSWLTIQLLRLGAKIIGVDISKINKNYILKDVSRQIKNIQADVANLKLISTIINRYKPEIIFHLAAQAIVAEAVSNPVRTFQSNIEGTWNVLEACRGKRFIEAIIVASSDKAYGAHKNLPYLEDTPLKGAYPYDVSKSCADLLAYAYFRTYRLPVCVTRCGNVFGPGDLHFSRIVPDAMRSIIKKKRFIIRSDGKFTRDYIYVEDVIRGYILLAEKMKSLKLYGQAFNFSNESPFTVLELFRRILEVSGEYNLKPKILNEAKYEIRDQYLSAKKAKRVLGWRPKCSLKEGLKQTLKWYKDFFQCR